MTFKYGLGAEFIEVLKTLHKLGLDRTETVRVGGVEVSPRDVVAACLPDPATLGDRMTGKTCAGLWVRGTGTDGRPRSTYLYHVVDNEWSMREYGTRRWSGRPPSTRSSRWSSSPRARGAAPASSAPRLCDAQPFLDLLGRGIPVPVGHARDRTRLSAYRQRPDPMRNLR